jgi:hypothetical protein
MEKGDAENGRSRIFFNAFGARKVHRAEAIANECH